jgi:hypothetical protein
LVQAASAHPAFKYAVVVAGIAALVAIVSKFGLHRQCCVWHRHGLFLMFVSIFSVAARAKDHIWEMFGCRMGPRAALYFDLTLVIELQLFRCADWLRSNFTLIKTPPIANTAGSVEAHGTL